MVPFKQICKNVVSFASRNSSTILTGIAVSGVVGSVILAAKISPKANDILENKRKSMEDLEKDKDDIAEEDYKEARRRINICFAKDMAKATWPLVATMGITITSIIGAHKIDIRKQAALAATLSLTEDRLKKYTEKTKEVLGEKKEQKIKDDICKSKIKETPIKDILETGKGDVLCLDAISGRYFKCNADFIRNRVNVLNQRLLSEMWIPLNDLYYELNLPGIKIGNDIGWNINHDGLIELDFSSGLTDDDIPVLVLDYMVEPRFDYKSY